VGWPLQPRRGGVYAMFPKAEQPTDDSDQTREAINAAILADRERTWRVDEPALLRKEQMAMTAVAPELAWSDQGAGSWQGPVPRWPFERNPPPGLDTLLSGRRLHVHVAYGHAFPMTAPVVWPIDPEPSIEQRTDHAWHVNGDGSLCLLESASAWTGREAAAELVVKAAGWFIEYLLISAGLITQMTSVGLAADLSMDAVITRAGSCSPQSDPSPAAGGANLVAGAQGPPDGEGGTP
jgi:hypothetical protein